MAQAFDVGLLLARDLLLHPAETVPLAVGVGGFQPGVELVAIEVQYRRQNIGRDPQVRNLHGADIDRIDGLAHGEYLEVTIENGAARRGDLDYLGLLFAGGFGIVPMPKYLEVEELAEDGASPESGASREKGGPRKGLRPRWRFHMSHSDEGFRTEEGFRISDFGFRQAEGSALEHPTSDICNPTSEIRN